MNICGRLGFIVGVAIPVWAIYFMNLADTSLVYVTAYEWAQDPIDWIMKGVDGEILGFDVPVIDKRRPYSDFHGKIAILAIVGGMVGFLFGYWLQNGFSVGERKS